ncbi:MAG: thiamine-phosphate kinase, partial [Gemmatimonadaceae bacterium]
MTHGVSLGPGREFELIGKMRERWGSFAVGIGDDAAVIRPTRGEQLVVSTDSAVEFVHFKRDWFSLDEIGYRAVTAALSDLAAMAAAPLGVLVAIQIPDDAEADLLLLADGVKAALTSAHTVIVGGNLARAKTLSLTTTVAGSVFSPLTRSEARPGDLLYLTGQLGGPRAALRALQSSAKPSPELMARLTAPLAR